ncbi:MAG: amidohydrolase family protein [Lentisphaerae bacterium]|nr:amidohydrolase family protein [Lentisphaerota bacterium]
MKTPIIDAYCALGTDREYDLDADTLLRGMDQAGVDRAVIAPVDRQMAVYNREGNEFLLKTAAAHRDRFIPACSVNPWYGPPAVAELRRAVEAGARLLVLFPLVQGMQANDELMWPVVEAAAALRVPVYIHVGAYHNSTPWQVVDLADRYPQADLIMGHCGATDFWMDVINAAKAAPNICIESSLARPFLFKSYVEAIGFDRGLMGSYSPIDDFVFEWEEMRKLIPPEKDGGVYGKNLLRLLEKRGPL